MTVAADVVNLALRQLGYCEFPSGSNQNKFGAWYGMNGVPWCACFVSYCFYNAGLPLPATTPKGFAYCPFGVNWFKQLRRFDLHPAVGDVVFYDWKRDGVADHVGIVEKVNSDNTVTAIEGNTSESNNSNGGAVMRRVRSLSLIQGFGHPAYDGKPKLQLPMNFPKWAGRLVTLTSPPASGKDIETWQLQMISRGWRIAPDIIGTFGKRSHEVLVQFQKEKGLEPDGVLGPISWNSAWESPVT